MTSEYLPPRDPLASLGVPIPDVFDDRVVVYQPVRRGVVSYSVRKRCYYPCPLKPCEAP